MVLQKIVKYIFIGVIVIIAGLALAAALGYFNAKPYKAVPLGSRVFYVPNNRDPHVKIDKFPTVKPLPSEVITPTGQIVPKDSLNAKEE
jgi:hypothetical protein